MSFLGTVSALNGILVRPHDIRVGLNPDMAIAADDPAAAAGVTRATVDRVVTLGFEVRVELTSAVNGAPFTAQITRGDAEALGLQAGDTVYVRATRVPPIAGGPQSTAPNSSPNSSPRACVSPSDTPRIYRSLRPLATGSPWGEIEAALTAGKRGWFARSPQSG